jgi:hypothetical protein
MLPLARWLKPGVGSTRKRDRDDAVKYSVFGKFVDQSPWLMPEAHKILVDNRDLYHEYMECSGNIFASIRKDQFRGWEKLSGTTKWKFLNFRQRWSLLMRGTHWFKRLKVGARTFVCRQEANELRRAFELAELTVTCVWYSGGGYGLCDQVTSSIISCENAGSADRLGIKLKRWKKELRKSFFSEGPWVGAPPEVAFLNRHPLRSMFDNRDFMTVKAVIALTETRSTKTVSQKLVDEAVGEFLELATQPAPSPEIDLSELPLRNDAFRGEASVVLSKAACYENPRSKKGRFGHMLDLLERTPQVRRYDLHEGLQEEVLELSDVYNAKGITILDAMVQTENGVLPNFYSEGFGRYFFSACYADFRARHSEGQPVRHRLLAIRERGKARILMCAEGSVTQLQFPFSKMAAAYLLAYPEVKNGLVGTDDSWQAYVHADVCPDGQTSHFMMSDDTASTDSPSPELVDRVLDFFRRAGVITRSYFDLLLEINRLPRIAEVRSGPHKGEYRLLRGIPMGDPVTKAVLTTVKLAIVRKLVKLPLVTEGIRCRFTLKGDDILGQFTGAPDTRRRAELVLEEYQLLLRRATLQASAVDTYVSTYAFYCEGAFRAPRWDETWAFMLRNKLEDTVFDTTKGRFILPLQTALGFKPGPGGGGGLLPFAKISQLCKRVSWYAEGSFSRLLVEDMILNQKKAFRTGHLRDFWYPFPEIVGGLNGHLVKPPEHWLPGQEDAFYWVHLYLLERSQKRDFGVPPHVRRRVATLTETSFVRKSDRAFTSKRFITKIDLVGDYGIEPLWDYESEAEAGTNFKPVIQRMTDVVAEGSLSARIRSFLEMCGRDDRISESRERHEPLKVPFPPFPEVKKAAVWKYYSTGRDKLFRAGPWRYFIRSGLALLDPLQVGTPRGYSSPEGQEVINWISSYKSGSMELSIPPNADDDLTVAYAIAESLRSCDPSGVYSAGVVSGDFAMAARICSVIQRIAGPGHPRLVLVFSLAPKSYLEKLGLARSGGPVDVARGLRTARDFGAYLTEIGPGEEPTKVSSINAVQSIGMYYDLKSIQFAQRQANGDYVPLFSKFANVWGDLMLVRKYYNLLESKADADDNWRRRH